MLTSHFIRAYAHKVASHFDHLLWLRFLVFVALTVMSLSDGFSQVLIDVPVDQLINFRDLITSDYSFSEEGSVSVVWSNPTLFESSALEGVDFTIDIGNASFFDSRNVEGASVGTLIFSSYHNPVFTEKREGATSLNHYLPFGSLHVPDGYLKNLKSASKNIVSSGFNRLEESLGRPTCDLKTVAFRGKSRPKNKEDGGVYRLNDNGAQADGTRRVIDVISVNGETVIDFSGGTRATPNILEVTVLVIPTDNDTLVIKNWVEYSDYFLISRQYAPDEEVLSRIQFKGYGRGAKMRYYDETHWEIVPASEVVLYGAIFGATALGSFAWRKRRRAV